MPRVVVAKTFLEIAYEEREKRIVAYRNAGVQIQDIAKMEGVTPQRISQILAKVKLRQEEKKQ